MSSEPSTLDADEEVVILVRTRLNFRHETLLMSYLLHPAWSVDVVLSLPQPCSACKAASATVIPPIQRRRWPQADLSMAS